MLSGALTSGGNIGVSTIESWWLAQAAIPSAPVSARMRRRVVIEVPPPEKNESTRSRHACRASTRFGTARLPLAYERLHPRIGIFQQIGERAVVRGRQKAQGDRAHGVFP